MICKKIGSFDIKDDARQTYPPQNGWIRMILSDL